MGELLLGSMQFNRIDLGFDNYKLFIIFQPVMRNTCNYLLSGEELDDDEDLNSIERDITDISLEVCYRQIVYFEYPFSFLQKP